MHSLVLRFKASDRPGILAAVTPLLAGNGCDIRQAQSFGDPDTGFFFVRMELASPLTAEALATALAPSIPDWAIEWQLADMAAKPRLLVAVSKFGHCLIDLIHKAEIGALPVEIVAIVSNHDDMRASSEWHGLPFHRLPDSAGTAAGKARQEEAFAKIVQDSRADIVVLARYMQILSDGFAASLAGRCINIHHSFLPSFKGARPYHQAHARGVKLIGATAHYVTADLDEGPIIEQDVRRVSHAVTPEQMVEIGREVEASVLSRAVRWHAERRVFIDGGKTVVLG